MAPRISLIAADFALSEETMNNGKLVVLQLIRNLDIGGAQEVARTLAAYLKQGDCMPVVATFRDGPLRQDIERMGIPVEVLPDRKHSIVALPLFLRDMWRLRQALAGLVRQYRVDVVQTHLLQILDLLVLTLRIGTNLRLVFWTVHNYNFVLRADQLTRHKWLLGPKRMMYRLLYRGTSRWVDGLIAVSDEVETAILQHIGAIQNKIAVICNGVDTKRYQQASDRARIRNELGLHEDARLLTVVGTLKEQKGHRFLIDAVASIIANFPDLHILLVGDGGLKGQLQEQASNLGLSQRIHFLGSRSDVPDILAASSIFVLPSLWEGLPMALIEAMASGLPIIATEVSGTKQVMIPETTGLLVPPGSSLHLSEAIVRLLSEPALARSMGIAARQRVESGFSANKQAQEHIALYRRAWNAKAARR